MRGAFALDTLPGCIRRWPSRLWAGCGQARNEDLWSTSRAEVEREARLTGPRGDSVAGTYALGYVARAAARARRPRAHGLSSPERRDADGWRCRARLPDVRRTCRATARSRPGPTSRSRWQDLTRLQFYRGVTAAGGDGDRLRAGVRLRRGAVRRRLRAPRARASPGPSCSGCRWRARGQVETQGAAGRTTRGRQVGEPVRVVCPRHRLRGPRARRAAAGGDPGVGRVDLADLRLGIVIEVRVLRVPQRHALAQRDVRRYTACARLGLVVVRVHMGRGVFDTDYCRPSAPGRRRATTPAGSSTDLVTRRA